MVELYLHCPTRLHVVVLNQLSTGTILPLPLLISSESLAYYRWYTIQERNCVAVHIVPVDAALLDIERHGILHPALVYRFYYDACLLFSSIRPTNLD
jgi:hypothetical protein